MKIQFKEQNFQIQAVSAVVDCFAGQTLKTNRFTLERNQSPLKKHDELTINLNFGTSETEDIGYRNSAIQISENQILKNIQSIQRLNDIKESQVLEFPSGVTQGYNLTVEMETGTGKTYTYIRTMYELNSCYGWSKFIIIVPSIAIREGIYKSFELTQDHFQQLYGYKISPFIYNSSRRQDIENFASDNRISVMIINTQAFNKQYSLIMSDDRDQYQSQRPIDLIAKTNPILIIDEPQSVDGDKTLKNMQDFNPLFTLRYSATHKVEYNKIYRLDALDAYNKRLVKRIQVKGINLKGSSGTDGYLYLEQISLSATKPPYAILEFEKRIGDGVKKVRQKVNEDDNLYDLSGSLPVYKNHVITEINGYANKIVIKGEDIFPGEILNDKDESAFRRIQIRETIISHMQKEKTLYEKNIKVLSLFFIDSVDKYRVYDENGNAKLGEYAQIFEEEYKNCANEFKDLFHEEYNSYLNNVKSNKTHQEYMPNSFFKYLDRDNAANVHNGYFSIDKKGKSIDSITKKGSEDSDDISAYDLIMKDKERLLSFEEPTRFIFSHSALKEGWDNPNVFQICALKGAGINSQIRRRQEVGRGMRLCVDSRGIRQDFELIGEQVHEINKLTVIASEAYEDFAKGLQNEIATSLKDRPQKAELKFFIGKIVVNEQNEEHRLTEEEAKKLYNSLIKNDVIDDGDKITQKGQEMIEANLLPLPESLGIYKSSVIKLLKSIYTESSIMPEDERKTIILNTNANFKRKEFQDLWNKINIKTIYEVKFDTEKLIQESVHRINKNLNVSEKTYEIKTGELKDGSKEEMQDGSLIVETQRENFKLKSDIYTNAVYDIVGEIEVITGLTRQTIVNILKAIVPEKFYLVRKNPEEFIAKISKIIHEIKASLVINNIIYHKTDERYDSKTVFSNDKSVLRDSELLKKHIYDYLISGSKIEANFTKDLENSVEVVVYAKLPKSFYISTPVANYSPDWAIVFDKNKARHIYFIAETKGSESDLELREIEKLKIYCAEEHFKSISNDSDNNIIKFAKISSFDKLLELVTLVKN
jgi:type III restriction enzyme